MLRRRSIRFLGSEHGFRTHGSPFLPVLWSFRSIDNGGSQKAIDVHKSCQYVHCLCVFLCVGVFLWGIEREQSCWGSRLITFINQGPFIRLLSIIADDWVWCFLFVFQHQLSTYAICCCTLRRGSVWEGSNRGDSSVAEISCSLVIIMGRHQTVSSWHLLIPSSSALSFWTKHYYWVIISDVPLLYSTQLSIGHSITQKCFSLSLSIAQLTWMESCGYGTLSRFNFIFISPFDCYSIRGKLCWWNTLCSRWNSQRSSSSVTLFLRFFFKLIGQELEDSARVTRTIFGLRERLVRNDGKRGEEKRCL